MMIRTLVAAVVDAVRRYLATRRDLRAMRGWDRFNAEAWSLVEQYRVRAAATLGQLAVDLEDEGHHTLAAEIRYLAADGGGW